MTLKEVMGCMENADRIRIMETGRKDPLYTGYLGTIQYYLGGTGITEEHMGMEVEKIRVVPEIRHRKWKEKRLAPPMLPDQTPKYLFADMQMEIYSEIWIGKGSAA